MDQATHFKEDKKEKRTRFTFDKEVRLEELEVVAKVVIDNKDPEEAANIDQNILPTAAGGRQSFVVTWRQGLVSMHFFFM